MIFFRQFRLKPVSELSKISLTHRASEELKDKCYLYSKERNNNFIKQNGFEWKESERSKCKIFN